MHPAHDMIRLSKSKNLPVKLFDNISRLYEYAETPIDNNAIVIQENEGNVVKGEITVQLMSKNLIIKENESNEKKGTELPPETCSDAEIIKNNFNETIEEGEKMSYTDITNENDKELPKTVNQISITDRGKSNQIIETTCPEVTSMNHGNLTVELEKMEENESCPIIDQSINNIDEQRGSSNTSNILHEKMDNVLTSLTKEELKSFETNAGENNVESTASQDSYQNIQEEIESLLAPLTPLPDLESVNNVMKINKGNGMDMDKPPGDIDENNDEKVMNAKHRFSFPNDKKSKDRENSAIASNSSFGKNSIHSCLEDSLRKLEDTMKSASTKFGEYGENDAGHQFTTSELSGSSSKSDEKESINPSCFKQPEITPTPKRHYNPRIANALDQMIAMGFSDNDGWLTELLVRKHGDIIQVLDILSPVSK